MILHGPSARSFLPAAACSVASLLSCGSSSNPSSNRTASSAPRASSELSARSEAREQFVEANGQRLRVLSEGEGQPIVLLHGWPETAYAWRKMIPDLARDHRVFAFDLRGAGESSLAEEGYDKKTMARDVHEALRALGVSRAEVVGHDWGAAVAYAYAAQFPEAVSHLILCEGLPIGPWLPKLDIYWYFAFMRIKELPERVTAGREREYLEWFYQSSPAHRVPDAIDDDAVSHYLQSFGQPGRMTAGFELYRALPRDAEDNAQFAKTPLTMPVLAVTGEQAAGDHVRQAMARLARNLSSVVMQDTGHFIPEERPAAFADLIRSFNAGKLARDSTWRPDAPTHAPDRGKPIPPLPFVNSAPEPSGLPLPTGFRSRFVAANGQRLHFVVGGRGPALLLIHGWPETWYEWRKVMPLLAQEYTLFVPDLRGFGDSSRPATGYDKKTLAEDLAQAMHALGQEQAFVVGHDWGAPVAFAYAANHPGRARALVVVEGMPNGPWTKDDEPFWFFGFQRIPNYAESVVLGHEREYLSWFYQNPQLSHGAIDDTARNEYLRTYASPSGIRAGCELYRSIETDSADNAHAESQPLALPVLAIGAEAGNGPAVEATMKHVASRLTAVLMKDTGHFVPEEKPEQLAREIRQFLRSLSPT